jgi:hypothetical protein
MAARQPTPASGRNRRLLVGRALAFVCSCTLHREAQPPRVVTVVHHAALAANQADSNSVSNVPSQLEQRPGRTGARWTVSDRPHITQYRRTVVRAAGRSAARSSRGASSSSARSRCTPFLRSAFDAFRIFIMVGWVPTPESFWLERRDSDGAGPRQHDVRVTKCRGTSQR